MWESYALHPLVVYPLTQLDQVEGPFLFLVPHRSGGRGAGVASARDDSRKLSALSTRPYIFRPRRFLCVKHLLLTRDDVCQQNIWLANVQRCVVPLAWTAAFHTCSAVRRAALVPKRAVRYVAQRIQFAVRLQGVLGCKVTTG